ncbi:MAG: acetoacetate decarboxylase family protein [Acidimicrobiales bacterium]
MPLMGTLDVGPALATAPTMKTLSPEPWSLPGADLLQVSYEVEDAPALAVTPPALHPSIPPYVTFSYGQYPESPHGPFTLAMVRLIVRAGIRPRGLLLGSWCDNPAAAEALRTGWGYRVDVAEVSLTRRYGAHRGVVTIDGEVALDAAMLDPEPIVPGDLELFDNLHLTNLEGADPVIVQVDPGYQYHRADRGDPELAVFDAGRLGISGIVPNYAVVGVGCSADVELGAPRFVIDPEEAAVKSTRRL